MLGGNDLLQGNSVETVAQRMEVFLSRIPLEKPKGYQTFAEQLRLALQ